MALRATAEGLDTDFNDDWLGQLYQYANRLAHLYFLRRVLGVPAWLAFVYFLDDPHCPTDRETWVQALGQVKERLGISKVPHAADVFLTAQPRTELLRS